MTVTGAVEQAGADMMMPPVAEWPDAAQVQALPEKLAQSILRYIDDNAIEPGEHLGEARLAGVLHVSRTPVRAALKRLADMDIVENRPNRGFFLKRPAAGTVLPDVNEDEEAPYFRIAEDRLAGVLPDRVTESELLRRYALSRPRLGRLLRRMAQEGWIERLPGKGWRFLPVLSTEDGYVQMYQFRAVIEPAALRLPGYHLPAAVIDKLRRQQQSVLEHSAERYSPAVLFQLGAYFHEAIVSGAGNDLMTEAIRRANQLRRLMDYRYRAAGSRARDAARTAARSAARIAAECSEHLHLLDMIEAGDLTAAASFLRDHLESALARKTGLLGSIVPPP
jgi:DNA-binding GntR family transcriptional regulator